MFFSKMHVIQWSGNRENIPSRNSFYTLNCWMKIILSCYGRSAKKWVPLRITAFFTIEIGDFKANAIGEYVVPDQSNFGGILVS